jgi:hypothetical protein
MIIKLNFILFICKNKITFYVMLLKFSKFKRFVHIIYNFCMFAIILYDLFAKFIQP